LYSTYHEKISIKVLVILIIIAYVFSFAIRCIWIYQFQDNPNFIWNGQLMINTNDGYFFASGVQELINGTHEGNPRVPNLWEYGTVAITALIITVTPLSLETATLYMPVIISSFVVIPIILIARLYKMAWWGFFSALLGSIAWSYYNRTMAGYYDTDMFSAMAPMFILYFLMKSTIEFNLRSALYAALFITIYPFLYDAGRAIIYTMGIIYAIYMIFYHKDEKTTYLSVILVFVALLPFPIMVPYNYIVKLILLILLFFILDRTSFEQKKLIIATASLFVLFMYFGNVFSLIFSKITGYIATGTALEGLHFYGVKQTVREAGSIPFSTFANRISGSQIGVLLAFIGYIALVVRHRAFILALPLIGIGVFALVGGLRFTVYAVPVAAMSAIYLFFLIGNFFKDKKIKYSFIVLATATMIYPNIIHIIGYKIPTVLSHAEVQDLDKLKQISNSKDYTLTWWDYGYPVWYYSHTSTLIDGGKHSNDNYIVSKILQTSSPELAANLARLAVETYVDSNYSVVADTIFKNGKMNQLNPDLLLSELENNTYTMPKKTRDIYLYLPYKMLNIFPTVAKFSNLDLITGEEERKMEFYPTFAIKSEAGILSFRNGIIFDSKTGNITIGKKKVEVKYFIATQNIQGTKILLQSQLYHADGKYAIVYMKSYKRFIIMDVETFNSTYVQMFILGKYDENLFELVISSPYSRIYKLKI